MCDVVCVDVMCVDVMCVDVMCRCVSMCVDVTCVDVAAAASMLDTRSVTTFKVNSLDVA